MNYFNFFRNFFFQNSLVLSTSLCYSFHSRRLFKYNYQQIIEKPSASCWLDLDLVLMKLVVAFFFDSIHRSIKINLNASNALMNLNWLNWRRVETPIKRGVCAEAEHREFGSNRK